MPVILSVFDGISCGHHVLTKLGVTDITYYASEVNAVAESVSNNHYPDIVRLGDVTQWRTWLIDWSSIDLFIGGSPCQGFSSAGNKGGTMAVVNGVTMVIDTRELYLWAKAQDANFLSESHLFWEYVLILDHIKLHNTRVKFMLENVRMSQNNLDMITKALGVEPVFINSKVVSAQSRPRFYWCNWYIPEPADRGIMLVDILQDGHLDSIYYLKPALRNNLTLFHIAKNYRGHIDKSKCLTSSMIHGPANNGVTLVNDIVPSEWNHSQAAINYMNRIGSDGRVKWSYNLHSDVSKGKSAYITANIHKGVPYNVLIHGQRVRKLTPIECERLQGLPDNYTLGPSNNQRYIMLGNGWQCDTIEHLFFWLLIDIAFRGN